MSNNTHEILGGSSAYIWGNCSGSIPLLQTLPPQEATEHTDRGTLAHKYAEILIEDWLAHKLTGSSPDLRLKELEDEEALELAWAARSAIWEKVLNESITDKVYGQEEKFYIAENLQMGGTVDFWSIYIDDKGKRVLTVTDFKFGYVFVPADKNAQLAFYATAIRERIRSYGKDIDYVRASIFQPAENGADPFRETIFTPKQLDTWKKKFLKAADLIFVKKETKLKTGSWCTYCKAQGICPAYGKELNTKTGLALVVPGEFKMPELEKLPDEIISKLVLNKDAIESFLDSAKTYAKQRFLQGNPVPGTKVVEGTAKRRWHTATEKVAEELKAVGITDPLVVPAPKLRGITEIEKELTKLHGKEDAKNILADKTERGPAPQSLVPESDKRSAIENATGLLTPIKQINGEAVN